MIVDLQNFVRRERPQWERLAALLERLARDPWATLSVEEAREFERLYQRAAADLARLSSYAAEPQAREYLEALVARGHAEIHGTRAERQRFSPTAWVRRTLPAVFRRRLREFGFALLLLLVGTAFGAGALAFDPDAKEVLIPFAHLHGNPADRVAEEQRTAGAQLRDRKARFSGMLMTHNTQVTLMAAALGTTCGLGTLVLMFYNGVILGAVAADYLLAGQGPFLFGWLLPHGSVEIPAMLIGGQAGFVLAGAILGRGRQQRLAARLRAVMPEVVTLCFGAALMLVWAGLVEAFFSQYHEPVLPYPVKIAFGLVELAALAWYFLRSGAGERERSP